MAETGNIKTFESPIDKLTITNVGAEAYEMMGRHVAATYHQAGQSIGGAISSVGEQLEQHDTVMQTADLMKNMSDLEIKAHNSLLNARNTVDIHDPDAVNKFMGGFDEDLQNITSKTYTPKAYDAMTRMTSDFNVRTRQGFTSYQSEAQANDGLAALNQSTTNWANLGNRDPNYMKAGLDAVDLMASTLPAEHRAQYSLQHKQEIANSTGEGIVSRVEGMKTLDLNAVTAAQGFLNNPKNGFVDNMSAPKFAELNARLDNVRRLNANQTIAGMELNFPAMMKTVSFSGQVPGELAAGIGNLRTVGTPEAIAAANKAEQGILDAKAEYGARQVVNKTPADQFATVQDAAHNAVRNPNLSGSTIAQVQSQAKALDELWKQRKEAFSGADPTKQGQWEIDNNPAVSSAYDAWKANPNAQTFLNYYQKSYADQRFLEPGSIPSVLTPDIENDAHKIMHEITNDPKAGPAQADVDLAKMKDMYGPAWPQIAGDLAKRKIFTGDQLVAASLHDNPSAKGWSLQLLRGSAMTSKQREEFSGITDTKAENMVRPLVEPLVASMGNINNGAELADMYISAAAKVIQMGKLTDATQVVKTMFLDSFKFVGPSSAIRLPAGLPDSDAIGDGARNVLRDIGNHDLVVPSTERLGSVNAKEAWGDAIRANGVFFTSPDGHSATLHDSTGQPVMERNKQGKIVPVQLTFEELARLGKGNPVAQSTISAEESHIK